MKEALKGQARQEEEGEFHLDRLHTLEEFLYQEDILQTDCEASEQLVSCFQQISVFQSSLLFLVLNSLVHYTN